MSTDYPDKCQQFNHVWQQKRRAFLTNGPTISHISNQSSISTNTQSTNSTDNGDKNRVSVNF